MSGATLGANSLVILVAAAGPERRGKAVGVMAAAQAVGLGLGPALGGALLAAFGWRAIFWVTVPFALIASALAWVIVPKTKVFAKDARFDALGAALLAPALVALLLAITELPAWGLSAPLVVTAFAALILLALFVWREAQAPAPLIHLSLFRVPAFSAGAVGVLVSYGLLYGMLFAMSFALVRGYHDPSYAAGLRLTIVPVALGIVAPFSGALADKRPRLVMLGGMVFCGFAALALTRLLTGSPASFPGVMGALAAFGVGLGLYIAPNNSATSRSCARRPARHRRRAGQPPACARDGRRRRRGLRGARLAARSDRPGARAHRWRERTSAPRRSRRRVAHARGARCPRCGHGVHSQRSGNGSAQGLGALAATKPRAACASRDMTQLAPPSAIVRRA